MKNIPREFNLGELTLVVNRPGAGSNCFVTFLGAGAEGARPMLGTLPMTAAELGEVARVAHEADHWSPLRRVLRNWDWSSILVEAAVPDDALKQLIAAMVLVEQSYNSERPAQIDDESRCAWCGWPLAEAVAQGCVRGNCSQRPLPEHKYAPGRASREAKAAGRG